MAVIIWEKPWLITAIMFVSVIICTYKRHSDLRDTLEDLTRQQVDPPIEYEIIVIDHSSSYQTADVLRSYKARLYGRLRHFFEAKQGLSIARNRGIRESKGE